MNSANSIFQRHTSARISEALADTPVVFICGPRQSGKTTLARQFCGGDRHYLTLDDQTTRLAARQDPLGLIRQFSNVVIDEVQRAPELFLAIKQLVDAERIPGRFLLTGSANIMSIPTVSESLAGRMETIPLLPLAQSEIEGCRTNWLDMLFGDSIHGAVMSENGLSLKERVIAGGYPEALARQTSRRRTAWARQYLDALLQRDVREIASLDKIGHLPHLLRALAQVAGQICNYSQLAGQIGIDHKTAQKYLAIFEQLFLLKRLDAFAGNHLNRLVKAPKLQFLDSGLLCTLSGVSDIRLPQDGKVYGRILETFVYGEILKQMAWSNGEYRIMYYRDKDQNEVDFVLENSVGRLVGIEVKAAASVSSSDLAGLRRFRQAVGTAFQRGYLLYDGTDTLPLGDNLWAMPVASMWQAGR